MRDPTDLVPHLSAHRCPGNCPSDPASTHWLTSSAELGRALQDVLDSRPGIQEADSVPFLMLPHWLPAGEVLVRKPSQPSGSELQAPSTGARSDPEPCSLQKPRALLMESTLASNLPQAVEARQEVKGRVEIRMQRNLGGTGGEQCLLLRRNCSPATARPIHHRQPGNQ